MDVKHISNIPSISWVKLSSNSSISWKNLSTHDWINDCYNLDIHSLEINSINCFKFKPPKRYPRSLEELGDDEHLIKKVIRFHNFVKLWRLSYPDGFIPLNISSDYRGISHLRFKSVLNELKTGHNQFSSRRLYDIFDEMYYMTNIFMYRFLNPEVLNSYFTCSLHVRFDYIVFLSQNSMKLWWENGDDHALWMSLTDKRTEYFNLLKCIFNTDYFTCVKDIRSIHKIEWLKYSLKLTMIPREVSMLICSFI
jgi:hypothetical protein